VTVKGFLPDFELLELSGRSVSIVFDSNVTTNEMVAKARLALANELRQRGAKVSFIDIPENYEVNGIDDLLGRWEEDEDTAGAIKRGLELLESGTESADESDSGGTQSARIIRLVENAGASFFHTAEGEAFVNIPANSHSENHKIKSTFFREWVGHSYWNAEEKVPSTKALQDAINALTGRARFGSPEEEIFVRLAEKNGRIYLDLSDEKWQVVEISSEGWRTIEGARAPVKFRRPKGLLPLPIPHKGGCPTDLKDWINVSDEHFPLVAIWLIACFRTGRPFPVLILNGEQGSAKSTTSRVLRRMIDPNVSELRTAPRDERDLMIAANNGWILAYDNLSKISDWLSDALCRISTGGGFATRTLYENDEETMFAAKRPLLLNGITELATRPDLLDRSLIINCPNISRSKRRDEETFWPRFEAALPKLFGSFLTALSSTLKGLPNVKLTEFERMADFEKLGVAAEAAIGLPLGTFRQAYSANRRDAVEIALESSVTATLVLAFMNDREKWTGMATNLLGEMAEFAEQNPSLRIRRDDLPKGANVLSGELKKVSPTLRSNGIEFKRAKSGSRTIILQRTRKSSSESSQSSEAAIQRDLAEIETDDPATIDDIADDKQGDRISQRQPLTPPQTRTLGDVGDMDDRIRPSDPSSDVINVTRSVAPTSIAGAANGRPYGKCLCGKHSYLDRRCPFCSRAIKNGKKILISK
jgi:hypothetical protein